MIRRPLCMACVLLLVIQTVRVCGLQSTPDQQQTEAEQIMDGTVISGSGTVWKIEDKSKNTAVYLKQNQILHQAENLEESKLLVYIGPEQLQKKLNIGDRVFFQGEKASFETARNPGNFDPKSYYRIQGIHAMIQAEKLEIACPWEQQSIWRRKLVAGIENKLYQLRVKWAVQLKQSLGEYYGSTMSAVLLGDKSGLDSEMKKLYQKNGIGHLLAISGLHMSLIGRSVYRFLRTRGASFCAAGMCSGGILFLYLILTGPQVSSLRAVLMFLIWIGAEVTGRKYDLLTSLSFTAAILSMYQPLYLTDRSFLLSFGAILGIALWTPYLNGKKVKKEVRKTKNSRYSQFAEKLSDGLAVSLSVNGMLLGVMLYFYYEIPPYSLLLNVLLVPLFPIVMLTGMLGLFMVGLPVPLSRSCFCCTKWMLSLYDWICESFSRIPGSRIVTGQPEKRWVVVYYVLILLVYSIVRYHSDRQKQSVGQENREGRGQNRQAEFRHQSGTESRKDSRKIVYGLLSGSILFFLLFCKGKMFVSSQLQVTMLDVGQGDGIFIKDRQGITYLVDGGSSSVTSVGSYRMEPFLLSQGVAQLDYVFVTHGDEDHVNGIQELLEGQRLGVKVKRLVLPSEKYMDEKLIKLVQTAAESGTKVLVIHEGEKAGNVLTCLGPAETSKTGETPTAGNEASMVLKLEDGGLRMLLTGDLEGSGEEWLTEKLKKEQEASFLILKAAHHGSKNSSSMEFLETVSPRVTLISAGKNNRYGHPHAETLERLQEIGSEVWSTQECGAITLKSDGEKIVMERYMNGRK